MHDTAMHIGSLFLNLYAQAPRVVLLDIGAQDVNGSLRPACGDNVFYLGLDYEHGRGVDVVIEAGKALPVRTDYANVVVSSSQMEHDPQFWTTFLEMCRVTAPGGMIYINTPSNGPFHRYPMDVWRFYPDAGRALERLARAEGHAVTLLESFTAERQNDCWNDFVAIFAMEHWPDDKPVSFIADQVPCTNVWKRGAAAFERARSDTEDLALIGRLTAELAEERRVSAAYKERLDALEARELQPAEPPAEG